MVNFETAKRLAPALFTSAKLWILESTHRVPSASDQQRAEQQISPDTEKCQQQQTASTEYLVYNWLESLFAWFQVIVLWHEPRMSINAISGLLSSFLLLNYFAPRFYATITIALFIYNLNKFWFIYIWPDIRVPPGAEREAEMRLDVDRFTYLHPQLMTLAELGQHLGSLKELLEYYLSKLLLLRQQKPLVFCSLVCSILSCSAYIGNRISGATLVLLSLAILLTAPGIYYNLLLESRREWLRRKLTTILQIIHNNSQHLENQVAVSETGFLGAAKSSEGITHQAISTKPEDKESLTSTVVSTTKSQALSLFEHLKSKSLRFGSVISQAEDEKPLLSHVNSDDEQIRLTTTLVSPTIDVPHNQDQDNQQTKEIVTGHRQRRHLQQEIDADSRDSSRFVRGVTEEDFSSNSSISLIGLDDEQQDGFVLL